MKPQIVICIPIELNNRQEIATALLDRYGTDYLFLGRIFQETSTQASCQINILPATASSPNENLTFATTFQIAGQNKITPSTREKIARHQQIVYLTSDEVGYDACVKIARFVGVLLKIGGIAVQVESAELACEAEAWLSKYDSDDVFDIYSLFVSLVEGEDCYYSCGMHNFGKADVSVETAEDLGLAIYVMNVFNYYRLTESPILQDGHTFQPDIESPRYTIELLEDEEYTPDSLQYNSYGRWHLSRQ